MTKGGKAAVEQKWWSLQRLSTNGSLLWMQPPCTSWTQGPNLCDDPMILAVSMRSTTTSSFQHGEYLFDVNRLFYSTVKAREWIQRELKTEIAEGEGPILFTIVRQKCLPMQSSTTTASSSTTSNSRKLEIVGWIWKPPYQDQHLQLTGKVDKCPRLLPSGFTVHALEKEKTFQIRRIFSWSEQYLLVPEKIAEWIPFFWTL
jgi:hypothetical protein